MAQERYEYKAGARLPNLELTWYDAAGAVLDLTAYTVTGSLTPHAGGDDIQITGTIGGSAAGIITIAWSADDLDQTPGLYTLNLVAIETATGKPRDYDVQSPPIIHIKARTTALP